MNAGIPVCAKDGTYTITLPLERYEQLARAEAELNILANAYRTMPDYRIDDVINLIFSPKIEKYSEKKTEETHAE